MLDAKQSPGVGDLHKSDCEVLRGYGQPLPARRDRGCRPRGATPIRSCARSATMANPPPVRAGTAADPSTCRRVVRPAGTTRTKR